MSADGPPGLRGPTAPVHDGSAEPPMTRWKKFRMVVKVVELRLRFIFLLVVTGLVFGYWDTIWNHYEKWTRPKVEAVAATAGVEFYCPMHPSVVQDGPGSCPICGMPLSKRPKGAKEALPEGVTARVTLAPFRVAQAGIRTVEVAYSPMAETLTTVGYVESDERRHAHITSRAKGKSRIESLHVNFVGQHVQEGEPMAVLYSPELYSATQELLTAQRFARRAPQARTALGRSVAEDPNDLVRLAVEKLKLWGLTQGQVDEILREGTADYRMTVVAPIGGVVFEQFVVRGQYVDEGADMFDVVDLGRVWVKAQVFEDQISRVRVGQAVEATTEAFPGEVFKGTVAFIDPKLDPATRTVDVRYDLENSDLRLRPGMFATVALKTPVADTPAFQGRFAKGAPRKGTVKLASRTAEEQKICPVTRSALGSMGEPLSVQVEGQKVWLCCEGCTEKIEASPLPYLALIAPPPADGVLSVPDSAVIDTGDRKVVYVESEPGVYQGRAVVLGPKSGDRFPVIEGLSAGEKVAAAGAFLIDAETRLNPAAGATYFGGSASPAPAVRSSQPHPH